MKLIVGLGNPGKAYAKTRHNVGFMVVDACQEALRSFHISAWQLSKKFNATIAGCTIRGDEKIILAKPMTFMNDSGQTVQLLAQFYKLTHRDIIVVHDDKDLPLGEIKVQTNRGDAGHNGVKSVITHIGTQDFMRIRIGVASDNPKKMNNTAEFVLQKFGIFERKKAEAAIAQSVEEIKKLIGIETDKNTETLKH